MKRWLLKEEPDCYSWRQLERDGKTVWSGVANNLALRHLRAMSMGDQAFFYATGTVKAILGVLTVTSGPYADPKEKDERLVVVDVAPLRALERPVSLAEIRADPEFAGWDLLRISRLSVMPVPPAMWERIEGMARSKGAAEVSTPRPNRKRRN